MKIDISLPRSSPRYEAVIFQEEKMYRILTTLEFEGKAKEALEAAAKGCSIVYTTQQEVTHEMLKDADVILGCVPTELLHDLPDLKFLQLDSAGSDGYARLPLFHGENAPLLANASGCYGVTISEFMVGACIMLVRHLQHYRDNMHKHLWERGELPDVITGKNALVIGYGDIGSNFAKRMDALGCRVYAVRRTRNAAAEYVREVCTLEDLPRLLPEMDFVGLCLPNSPATTRVINKETLALMKPTAIIVNVGRGTAIDSDALAEALKAHKLGGAALDVTDPEPLPADHPLWDCENCLITPHTSGLKRQADPFAKICRRATVNLENFLAGKPLESAVDVDTGYRII